MKLIRTSSIGQQQANHRKKTLDSVTSSSQLHQTYHQQPGEGYTLRSVSLSCILFEENQSCTGQPHPIAQKSDSFCARYCAWRIVSPQVATWLALRRRILRMMNHISAANKRGTRIMRTTSAFASSGNLIKPTSKLIGWYTNRESSTSPVS